MTHKHTIVVILSGLLAACGGGGSSPAQVDPKLVQAIQNGAEKANANIPSVGLPSKPFAGGFVTVAGQPAGYLEGTSPKALATQIAELVVKQANSNAELYRLLLSEEGLTISIAGDRIGTSAVNNMPIYADPYVYVAKLTSGGLVVAEKGKG